MKNVSQSQKVECSILIEFICVFPKPIQQSGLIVEKYIDIFVMGGKSKMNTYVYHAPLFIGSTKGCEVKRADGFVVGSVQRYFNSSLHRIVDSIIGRNNLIVRVKAMDSEGNTVIDAYTKMAMIKKPDYYIHFLSGQV